MLTSGMIWALSQKLDDGLGQISCADEDEFIYTQEETPPVAHGRKYMEKFYPNLVEKQKIREPISSVQERCYEKITLADLKDLQEIALREREAFFKRNPKYKDAYYDSLLMIALCQGAAKHYVDETNGIKDFDIWFFYRQDPELTYPYLANKPADSKLPKFGAHPECFKKGYKGRKVDLLGRSLSSTKEDPKEIVIEYLEKRKTQTAKHLATKAVVALWPEEILGEVIWPLETDEVVR